MWRLSKRKARPINERKFYYTQKRLAVKPFCNFIRISLKRPKNKGKFVKSKIKKQEEKNDVRTNIVKQITLFALLTQKEKQRRGPPLLITKRTHKRNTTLLTLYEEYDLFKSASFKIVLFGRKKVANITKTMKKRGGVALITYEFDALVTREGFDLTRNDMDAPWMKKWAKKGVFTNRVAGALNNILALGIETIMVRRYSITVTIAPQKVSNLKLLAEILSRLSEEFKVPLSIPEGQEGRDQPSIESIDQSILFELAKLFDEPSTLTEGQSIELLTFPDTESEWTPPPSTRKTVRR